MSENSIEIEVKSLLGSDENANGFREKLTQVFPDIQQTSVNNQLNHYFNSDGDFSCLEKTISENVSQEHRAKLAKIFVDGSDFSVRTRQKDETVLFVVKASIDDTTSENGIARMEFEEEVDVSLEELDSLIQSCGFTVQAKWSRYREEYSLGEMNMTLDRNAGYGWLAEFERVVPVDSVVADVRSEIDSVMGELGVEELMQDRLARMFDFYNQNWEEYYGTERVFVVE